MSPNTLKLATTVILLSARAGANRKGEDSVKHEETFHWHSSGLKCRWGERERLFIPPAVQVNQQRRRHTLIKG
jgi:hypothetical protein